MNEVNNFLHPFHYINKEGADTVVHKKYQNRAKLAAIVGGILTLGLAAAPILYGMAAYYRWKCLKKSEVQKIDNVAHFKFKTQTEYNNSWHGKFHRMTTGFNMGRRNDNMRVPNNYLELIWPMSQAFEKHCPQVTFDLILPISIHSQCKSAFDMDRDGEFRKKVDNPKTLILYITDGYINKNEIDSLKAKYYIMSWKDYDQLPDKMPEGVLAILKAENPENHSSA